MIGDAINVLLGYAAGATTVLSPCVLPLLPIILIGAFQQHVLAPLALAGGLATSFAAVGVLVSLFGFSLGIETDAIRAVSAAVLIALGAVLLVPALQDRFASIAAPLATRSQTLLDRLAPSSISGQFVIGMLLGVVWSPCAGPTLGAAVGLAAQGESPIGSGIVMLAFGLGAATPILALAYGSKASLGARRDRLSHIARFGKPTVGTALVCVGAFIITGFDKIVEASLTRAMPNWLVAVTTWL